MDNQLLGDWLSAFQPPPQSNIIEWCEANIILPPSNSEPGPLRYTAYQKGLVEAFADPNCDTMVLMLASQSGKSTAIDSALLYSVAQDPAPALLVHPSEGKALDYVRNRLDPLIASTPAVRALIGQGGRTGGGSSVRHKIFPGGSVSIGSSYNPDDLAARSIRFLLLDEIDRFARSAGTEGDPVQLAIKRTRTYRNRKIILASTPTAKNSSRINEWFLKGSQERFFIPCPECGTFEFARFDQLKWTPGHPETARLVCDSCAHHMTEHERLSAIELGSWMSTNDNAEKGVRSFHATEIVSRFSSLESVAAQAEEAEGAPEKKRVFHNTVLAETYDFGEEFQLDASELQMRAEPIPRTLPAKIEKIVVGVDVQQDRLEASVVGFGADNEAWVFQHHRFLGDTAGSLPYEVLDKLLGETFSTADGRSLPIASCACDANYHTTFVAQFVAGQRRKHRNVIAVKGTGGFDKPVIRRGSLLRGLTQLYLVGVDGVKAMIQRRLAMPDVGPGFIHLADTLEPTYFEGLTVETLRTRFVRGYAKQEFFNAGRNEPLDCLTYAVAVASITKATADKPKHQTSDIGERALRLQALHRKAA